MRRPFLSLLAAATLATGCAREPQAAAGPAGEEVAAPAGGSAPLPAVLIGVAIGAGLLILLVSQVPPNPDMSDYNM